MVVVAVLLLLLRSLSWLAVYSATIATAAPSSAASASTPSRKPPSVLAPYPPMHWHSW
jgi:hypothetical protein